MNKTDREALARFELDPVLFYDAIVRSTDDYIYIVDMARDEAMVSENMVRDFALPGRVFYGLIPIWGELLHERDRAMYFESIDAMLRGDTDEHNVEYQVRNRKGEYIWVACRGSLRRDDDGVPQLFAGVVTNLGDKGKVDHTTGLFTQEECRKLVNRILGAEYAAQGGILLLGLDNFTRINTLNDHIFGDTVLRQFAQSIQNQLPENAAIFRFDGDQFAIVFQDADAETVHGVYQKLHMHTNRRQTIDGISYFCTVSAGIAMIGTDADNYLDLIKYASSALEASKTRGKNTCTAFSPELIQAKLHVQELENLLQLSTTEDMRSFHLVYQPVLETQGMWVKGAEALLRWSCDRFGAISPAEFIPILESTGLIVPVGCWVLEEAVRTCRTWCEACPDFVMNVNVSYLQMVDPGFLPFLSGLLTKYGLNARHVLLEMTESYFVTDMEALQDTFEALRSMGARIAMDDFGTGYSSLGMLAQMPADVVKIDRAFIESIDRNFFNRAFIGSVIQLCHRVGIHVCVEGVERAAELETACEMEADSIQGFYVSRPVSREIFYSRFLSGETLTYSQELS